jgi:protein-L-isoaspartate(D-aspartate) O-methyltransferase
VQQNFDQARESMVECQVRPNKVTDAALLMALRRIPREKFLPDSLQDRAYTDEDIPLGNGRYLAEPMVLSRLLQAAQVRETDMVLEAGCGAGYATAVLSCLAKSVIGLEHDKHLAETGGALLRQLGIHNAAVVQQNDLQQGYAIKAPYNVILINGAVAAIPVRLQLQLADGGRLVTVLSRHGHIGTAVIVTRHGGNFSTQGLFEAAIPFLPGFGETKGFRF